MPILFEQKNIGTMTIKNRFVRSATAESAADEHGMINHKLFSIYRDLAKGDVGLIITGHAYIQPNGRCRNPQTGIYKDDFLPSLKELTNEVHKTSPDCKIAIQIAHAGRQAVNDSVADPVAPSAVTDTSTGITPRAMTEDEIEECIENFVKATERAKLAGFDGVQIHSAHGYLISSFNSPRTNLRNDKWGGNLENRMRFLLETYRRIRSKVGDDYPVFVKLNVTDCVDGGVEIDESSQIAKILSEEGIDAIEISGGTYESRGKGAVRTRIRKPEQEAYFLPYAEKIKEVISDVPLILVGGIRSASVMERILTEDKADFISLCRPFIREPDLVEKIKNGKDKVDCISCNGCMTSRVDVVRCVQI